MAGAMVPLMMATLAVVVGSQIAAVGSQVAALARVIPIYIAFVVIAVVIGKLAGRVARLEVPATRACLLTRRARSGRRVGELRLGRSGRACRSGWPVPATA